MPKLSIVRVGFPPLSELRFTTHGGHYGSRSNVQPFARHSKVLSLR